MCVVTTIKYRKEIFKLNHQQLRLDDVMKVFSSISFHFRDNKDFLVSESIPGGFM